MWSCDRYCGCGIGLQLVKVLIKLKNKVAKVLSYATCGNASPFEKIWRFALSSSTATFLILPSILCLMDGTEYTICDSCGVLTRLFIIYSRCYVHKKGTHFFFPGSDRAKKKKKIRERGRDIGLAI